MTSDVVLSDEGASIEQIELLGDFTVLREEGGDTPPTVIFDTRNGEVMIGTLNRPGSIRLRDSNAKNMITVGRYIDVPDLSSSPTSFIPPVIISSSTGMRVFVPNTENVFAGLGSFSTPFIRGSYLGLNDEDGNNLIRFGVNSSTLTGQSLPYMKVQDESGKIVMEYSNGKFRTTNIDIEGLDKSLVEKISELETRVANLESP